MPQNRKRAYFNVNFAEAVQRNASTLQAVFSKLSLEKLTQVANIDNALVDLLEADIRQRVKFGTEKIPEVQYTIAPMLKTYDQVSLSKINKFFTNSLMKPLIIHLKKESINKLNANVDNCIADLKNVRRKEFRMNQLIAQTLHKKPEEIDEKLIATLVFSHLSDLDSKTASDLSINASLIDNLTKKISLNIEHKIPEVNITFWPNCGMNNDLATAIIQTYNKHYPGIHAAVTQRGPNSTIYKFSFNLDVFLRSVIPATKRLPEKNTDETKFTNTDMSQTRKKNQANIEFEKAIQNNVNVLRDVFSKLSLDKLDQLANSDTALENLHAEIRQRVKFNTDKLSSELIQYIVAPMLTTHDKVSLSKTNKFFNAIEMKPIPATKGLSEINIDEKSIKPKM